jgi:hypothetical protein
MSKLVKVLGIIALIAIVVLFVWMIGKKQGEKKVTLAVPTVEVAK